MASTLDRALETERGDLAHRDSPKLWVFFDGDCPMCTGLARKYEGTLNRRGFALASLQTPWVREHFGLKIDEPLREMKVLTGDGTCLGGGDAVAFLAGKIWWAWPLYAAAKLPFGMAILRRAYEWIAARRTCANGSCEVPQPKSKAAMRRGWVTFIFVMAAATYLGVVVRAWIS
jgi:predicted DCC family thiol-disulfide oxidoreductase YuxK